MSFLYILDVFKHLIFFHGFSLEKYGNKWENLESSRPGGGGGGY